MPTFYKYLTPLFLFSLLTTGILIKEIPGQTIPEKSQKNAAPIVIGESIKFESKRLGESWTAMIYVPPGAANSKRRFPVIYVLDGEYNFLQTVSATTFLADNGMIPEVIVVGVRSVNRNRDFTPKLTKTSTPPPGMNDYGKADDFIAYLGDELIPFVENNYPTQPFRVLLGHSLGGLLADHSLITRPELFRGIVTLEPSLWWDDRSMIEKVDKFFRDHPQYTARLIMAEGSSAEGWRNDWAKVKDASPKSLRWSLIDIPGESHETMVFRGTYEAIRKMFEDYLPQMKNDESKATLPALENQYNVELSKDYGYPVEIPESALLEAARRASSRKDFATAQQILQKTVILYPSARSRQMLADAQDNATKNPRTEVNVSTMRVSAAEGAAFVGKWEGILKTEPGMPASIIITFEVVDGYLSGYGIAKGMAANGGDLRNTISAIRVKGDIIEWERPDRNGGTHVHIGKLKDTNTLEGHVELRGGGPIPPGFTLPKVTFSLTRK